MHFNGLNKCYYGYFIHYTGKKEKMCEYCSQELIDWVFNDFINQGGKIIYEENDQKPSRWWIITDYVNNTTIDKIKKLAVILSFGATGGFVQIEQETQLGDAPIVLMLKNRSLINEDELSMFVEFFYDKSHGSSKKFTP